MIDLTKAAYSERLQDGKLLLYSRNVTFYARVYKGNGVRRYIYKSLGTGDIANARQLAEDFYRQMPEAQRPRNYRLDPADKTLEWETTFTLTVLKWAHER